MLRTRTDLPRAVCSQMTMGCSGLVSSEDAISQRLNTVDGWLESKLRAEDLISRIPETLAWTTWAEMRDVLATNQVGTVKAAGPNRSCLGVRSCRSQVDFNRALKG